MHPYDTTEKALIGRRSREWTAVGQTQEDCVREMRAVYGKSQRDERRSNAEGVRQLTLWVVRGTSGGCARLAQHHAHPAEGFRQLSRTAPRRCPWSWFLFTASRAS